jgi:hypothetical protein
MSTVSYEAYLGKLRNNTNNTYISTKNYDTLVKQISNLTSSVTNNYLQQTEIVYTSTYPHNTNIGTTAYVTFINPAIDISTTSSSIFILETNNNIAVGTLKRIVNNAITNPSNTIYLYSINTNTRLPGFNSLGNLYNCYIFSALGDILELIWNGVSWTVKDYGSAFINQSV